MEFVFTLSDGRTVVVDAEFDEYDLNSVSLYWCGEYIDIEDVDPHDYELIEEMAFQRNMDRIDE